MSTLVPKSLRYARWPFEDAPVWETVLRALDPPLSSLASLSAVLFEVGTVRHRHVGGLVRLAERRPETDALLREVVLPGIRRAVLRAPDIFGDPAKRRLLSQLAPPNDWSQDDDDLVRTVALDDEEMASVLAMACLGLWGDDAVVALLDDTRPRAESVLLEWIDFFRRCFARAGDEERPRAVFRRVSGSPFGTRLERCDRPLPAFDEVVVVVANPWPVEKKRRTRLHLLPLRGNHQRAALARAFGPEVAVLTVLAGSHDDERAFLAPWQTFLVETADAFFGLLARAADNATTSPCFLEARSAVFLRPHADWPRLGALRLDLGWDPRTDAFVAVARTDRELYLEALSFAVAAASRPGLSVGFVVGEQTPRGRRRTAASLCAALVSRLRAVSDAEPEGPAWRSRLEDTWGAYARGGRLLGNLVERLLFEWEEERERRGREPHSVHEALHSTHS